MKNNQINKNKITGRVPLLGLPSKYLDMRVIGPAFVIALLWSLYISFYISATSIVEFFVTSFIPFASALLSEGWFSIMGILLRIFVFLVDFVVVFALCYLFIWIYVRENDKRLYLHYRQEKKR